jgi:hypothetical protein
LIQGTVAKFSLVRPIMSNTLAGSTSSLHVGGLPINSPTHEVIAEIERDTGVKVVSVYQPEGNETTIVKKMGHFFFPFFRFFVNDVKC